MPNLLPSNWPQLSIDALAKLAPIESVRLANLTGATCAEFRFDVKREDLLDRYLSGNKVYKLHHHLRRACELEAKRLVSFGGAYSNHLYALARAGKILGLPTMAVVRGEKPAALSSTLQALADLDMQFTFVSREEYRRKQQFEQQKAWQIDHRRDYIIPEGGGGLRGALGMADYWFAARRYCRVDYDHIVISAGTGASAAGIIAAEPSAKVHVISALKGSHSMVNRFERSIATLVKALGRCRTPFKCDRLSQKRDFWQLQRFWELHSGYHYGGYGPLKPEYCARLREHLDQDTLPLDAVYTGKAMLALVNLISSGTIRIDERVIFIHTGGLQGGTV